MKQGKQDDGFRMSDALWEQMEALLPAPKPHPLGCHRPRVSNRAAMDAILLVLRTGMQWNALDGTMTKAPLGGKKTGPNPCDRAKGGVKRSMLTEAAGVPLAVEVAPANRHDMKLVAATLVSMMCARPVGARKIKLCLDLGYDYDEVRRIVHLAGFEPVILGRRDEQESKKKPVQPAMRSLDHSALRTGPCCFLFPARRAGPGWRVRIQQSER